MHSRQRSRLAIERSTRAHRRVYEEASGGYRGDMRTVGLKTLKNKLSEYVRAASAGETVLVTDRHRVVAELVPPQPDRMNGGVEERYEQAVRAGLIARAPRPGSGPPPAASVMSFETLMDDLRQDRAER
jgi:prevent-host-death family protein